MAVGTELSLEEETHEQEGYAHKNVTGTSFTTPDGIKKLAMDVKLIDTTDDNATMDENIRDIKLLLGCLITSQEKFQTALLTQLQLITNEEQL